MNAIHTCLELTYVPTARRGLREYLLLFLFSFGIFALNKALYVTNRLF